MQLEDYFEFIPPPHEQIRLKGTRIGIEHVIRLYLDHMIPEQIAVHFVSPLSVEQVFATITFYLQNRERIDGYIKKVDEKGERYYQEYLRKPPSEMLLRMRAMKAEQEAAVPQ